MKKLLLNFFLSFFMLFARGQNTHSPVIGFHFAGGINVAFTPVLIYQNNPRGIGIELQPEYRLSKRIAVYGSTGYTNFFNKLYGYDENNNGKYTTYNVGFIPVLAGTKFYFTSNFFIGCKAGVAFINSNNNTTFLNNDPKSKTAFDIQPQVGFIRNKFQGNFGVNVFAQDDVHFSIGILYNFQ